MDIYDIALYVGYFLVVIGVIAAVVLPLIRSVGDPKSLLKTGISLVALLVVFAIGYFISDNEVTERFAMEPFSLTPGSSQLVGGLLIASYFLLVIAFASIFINEITKMVR